VPFPLDLDQSLNQGRLELTSATQRLLGDTIGLSHRDWRMVTHLPGWTRAHIATHLTHHAQCMTTTLTQLGKQPVTWNCELTDKDLWVGAQRSPLELTEDLDQSSAELARALDPLSNTNWDSTVITSVGEIPSSALILDRLNEVVIHHVDLNLSIDFTDLKPELVHLLLAWNAVRLSSRFTDNEITIMTDEGDTMVVGSGAPRTVRGSQASLLGWMVGRKGSSAILGAEEFDQPQLV
jgi:maleylpyruvate isomerase